MKRWLMAGVIVLAGAALVGGAGAAPLSRYFPDNALGVLEVNDLQGAVAGSGEFGQETIRLLGTAFSAAGGADAFGLRGQLTARALIGSVKDLNLALYSSPGKSDPDVLAVVRVGGLVGRSIERFVQDGLRGKSRRLREGAYVAYEDGLWLGAQNGLVYFSSNPDLLRAYLRRVSGQNLPVLVQNAAYRAATSGVGDGFFRHMVHFGGLAQFLSRDQTAPPRLIAALRTLNLTASATAITPEGATTRTLTQLNPRGGDQALYRLLTFSPVGLDLFDALPASAPDASVLAVDTQGWLEYLRGWLTSFEPESANDPEVDEVFGQLTALLGNEWGVVRPNLPNLGSGVASLLGTVFLGETVSARGLLGPVLSGNPEDETIYYAATQDGAGVLDALEQAAQGVNDNRRDDPNPPRLERTSIAGFDALELTIATSLPAFKLFVVNRENTVLIGSNRSLLEQYLTDAPLSETDALRAVDWPANLTGVQFAPAPIITDARLDGIVNALEARFRDLGGGPTPVRVKTGLRDWLGSWRDRVGGTVGWAVVNDNRLETYSLWRFRWN